MKGKMKNTTLLEQFQNISEKSYKRADTYNTHIYNDRSLSKRTINVITYNYYLIYYASCIFAVFFGVLFLYTGQIYGKFIYFKS